MAGSAEARGKMILGEGDRTLVALFRPPAPSGSLRDITAEGFVMAGRPVLDKSGDIKALRYHKNSISPDAGSSMSADFLKEHGRIGEVLGYEIEEGRIFDINKLKQLVVAEKESRPL